MTRTPVMSRMRVSIALNYGRCPEDTLWGCPALYPISMRASGTLVYQGYPFSIKTLPDKKQMLTGTRRAIAPHFGSMESRYPGYPDTLLDAIHPRGAK